MSRQYLADHVTCSMGLSDDVAYVTILLASIGLGKLVRLVPAEGLGLGGTFRGRK